MSSSLSATRDGVAGSGGQHPLGEHDWAAQSRPIDSVDSARPDGVSGALGASAEALAAAAQLHGHQPPAFDIAGRQLPAGRAGTGRKKRSGVAGKLHHGALADSAPLAAKVQSLSASAGWRTFAAPGAGTIRPSEQTRATLVSGPAGGGGARLVDPGEHPQVPRYYNSQGKPLMPAQWNRTPQHATRTELLQHRRRADMPNLGEDGAPARASPARSGEGSASRPRPAHASLRPAVLSPPFATAGPGGALAAAEDEPEYAAGRGLAAAVGASSRRRLLQLRRLRDTVALDDSFGGGVQIRGAAEARLRAATAAAARADQANEAAALAAAKRTLRMRVASGGGAGERGGPAEVAGAGSLGAGARNGSGSGDGIEAMAATALRLAMHGVAGDGKGGEPDGRQAGIGDSLEAARRAARAVRRPAAAASVPKTVSYLEAVDRATAAVGSAAVGGDAVAALRERTLRARRGQGLLSGASSQPGSRSHSALPSSRGRARDADAESLGSVEERAKPFDDPTRVDRSNFASRRLMLRERRKETTRAALAASGVGEREFGLDERVSPRSEDGEFWETGGHPRRTGGVTQASSTRAQLQRRRKARQAEDGRRFAPPEALGVHAKPLPSFEQTVGREGRGWFEVQEHKTNVATPWEGGELSRGGGGAMRASLSSSVAGAAGRRLDASTRRPIVADGLRREDDDHAAVADDPFKRRTIRHQDRPEVRRGRDAALPEPPSKVDHWRAFRESGGMSGAGPLDSSSRFTVQRWTTAVIEHRQAEERAFSNPGLDETGKQWRTDPADLKPMYSSFTADRRFREPDVPRVEDLSSRPPTSPLQRRRAERSLREDSRMTGGGSQQVLATRAATARSASRRRMRRRGSLSGTGTLLPQQPAEVPPSPSLRAASGAGSGDRHLSGSPTLGWGSALDRAAPARPILHTPTASGPGRAIDAPGSGARHPAPLAQSPVRARHGAVPVLAGSASAGSFAAVGPAARAFAEQVAPQLRKRRLWSEAATRRERSATAMSRSRGASTSSAPLLPSLGGTVASSGLAFLG